MRGAGDGGAYATAGDIARLWTALFSGRIVPTTAVAEMVRPQHDVTPSSRRYGLGFWLANRRGLPVVAWTECGASCLSLVGPRICWRVGGTGDIPVEALFPEGAERFELGSSGWLRVLGIDAVGGPPHCDFADEGAARVASRWCPDWLGVTLAGVILDVVGEVGD